MTLARVQVAIVAGMHRAGTSAVARSLEVLGFDLGPRLMSADVRMNARGFFEDMDIVAQDDALLARRGADWKSVALLDDAATDDPDAATDDPDAATDDPDAAAAARALLAARIAPTGRFACKDPRMPRVLPFWQRRLRELGLADGYVIAVRHPAAVVASLTARDDLDPRRSAWLWLVHLACSLAYTRGRPRVVVDYDRLLAAPERELGRIAAAFGLAAPAAGDAALAAFRDGFLSTALRHSHFGSDDLDPAAWPPLVPEAHALARHLAAMDAIDAAAEAEIDALWQRLRSYAALLDYTGDVEHAADQLAPREAELAWARASFDEARTHATDLAARLAAKEAELAALHAHAAATDSEASRYAASLRAALAQVERERDTARAGLGAIGRTRAGRGLLRWLGRSGGREPS